MDVFKARQMSAFLRDHYYCGHTQTVEAAVAHDHSRAIRIENAKRIFNAITNQGTAGKGLALRSFNLRRI